MSDPEAPERFSKGERTRAALLAAAIERFGREGYRGTSVADISRDAGLSATAAYAYFPSKEALFVAAVDEDAAAVIDEGRAGLTEDVALGHVHERLLNRLGAAVEHRPLARRVLAGLEPQFTTRLLEIPALEQLRKETAAGIADQQLAGAARADVDPEQIANGLVTITLSLLMSRVQTGDEATARLAPDVAAVLAAALRAPDRPRP